jgi:protease-4
VASAKGVRFILLFIVAAVIVSMTGVAASYFLLTRGPAVEFDSVLWLRVPANLGEQAPDDVFGLLDQGATVGSVVTALRKAKVDDRVSAVVLVPPATPGLWGTVQEIRDAVIDFKESGKPVVAHIEFGMGQAYYLATACDEIFMSPTSPLMLVGVASYELFFRGTLDKVGIEADMLSAGDFKTAINAYTESGFTPEHREVSEALSRDFYEQLVDGIAEGRQMTRPRVREVIDQGPFVAADAVSLGLVDDLLYEDELLGRLSSDDETVKVDFATYRRVEPQSLGLDTGPRIAVVYAEGTINFGSSTIDFPGSGQMVGSRTMTDAIREARDDPSIQAIVLRIDSPGGAATAADIIWRELSLAREQKPLVVSMAGVAASGGYYIAAPAHAIVAQPGTLTGSIGVFSGKLAAAGAFDKIGVGIEGVTHGEQADIFSPVDRFSDTARVAMQAQVDDVYERFLQVVAEGRAMSRDEVHAVAQGRVWTGRQALARGLVDELGGLRRAVVLAQVRAGIDAEDEVTLVPYPGPRSFVEVLTGAVMARAVGRQTGWLTSPYARGAYAQWAQMDLAGQGVPLVLMPGVAGGR